MKSISQTPTRGAEMNMQTILGSWTKFQGEWAIAIIGLQATTEIAEVTVVTKAGVASTKTIRPAHPLGHKNGAAIYAAVSSSTAGQRAEKPAAPRTDCEPEPAWMRSASSEARPAHNRGTAWEREFDCDYAI